LPLTLNAVVHRQNLSRLDAIIAFAVESGAERLEIAHAQYYGWALHNRAMLLPTREQLTAATRTVGAARDLLAGKLVINKEWRAVATRHDKTARSFPGVSYIAAAADWLKLTRSHSAWSAPSRPS